MEDFDLTPSDGNPPSARTAETLRELHARTQSALAAQRARMNALEAQLGEQLDSIAGAIAEQVSGEGYVGDGSPAPAEVEQLRAELEKTRSAWQAERQTWDEERSRLAAAEGDHAAALDQRHAELEARQQTLDERAAQLNYQDRELRQRQELIDAHAAQCAATQSQINESETGIERAREALHKLQEEVRASEARREQEHAELTARERECAEAKAALEAERAALRSEREAHASQQANETCAVQSATDELMAQLASAEEQLAAERNTYENELSAARAEHRSTVEERDSLSSALEAAKAELKVARVHAGAADERDELRQKFELAVDDVQRLRNRVTELEQELQSRPAADQTDSVELVHLRAERDSLVQRITELEQQAATPVDGDAEQERADLQRRFELAVEDVRDLKKRNAELEAELAEARMRSGPVKEAASPGGNSSWELMKKQMLANLEDEVEDGEYVDAPREKERVTIENTIQITDEVVANKDREIADLRNQLAAGVASGSSAAAEEDAAVQEMLDADEVIRRHRERIAQLEHEMQEKLRAAELELSVERAKIAREQTQLADLRAEIDAQRAQGNYGGAAAGPGQPPKRRWLSKLGLTGDDE